MTIKINSESAFGDILYTFWQNLALDKGARAQLRRCKNISQVIMTPSYQRLCARCGNFLTDTPNSRERLAAIAGLLSHLNTHKSDLKLPEQMAQSRGDRPLVSELRFRRLLQRDFEELYAALIRILRMLNGEANLYNLSKSIFYWGDSIKKEWAFAYFPRIPEKKSA